MFCERAVPACHSILVFSGAHSGIFFGAPTLPLKEISGILKKPHHYCDTSLHFMHIHVVVAAPSLEVIRARLDAVNSSPAQGRWIWGERIFNVPSNPNYSIIPRFCSKGEHESLN